jgi:hypothetical protein
MPGVAQAKWIKLSVTGTGVAPSPTNPVQLDFVLWNFNTATPNVWKQMGPAYGYAPLYGYGTGVSNSSPQTLQGPFLPQYTPGGSGNTFALNGDGTGFAIDLTSTGEIPYLVRGCDSGSGGVGVDKVVAIQLNGTLPLFSSPSTSLNVVDFLDAAITGTGTFACASCTGSIVFQNEGIFSFSWSNAQFDEIESVPTPLPIFGALSAFSFSRKLRKCINIQKIETFS